MKLLVLGGDARNAYLAQIARDAGWEVTERYLNNEDETAECGEWDVVALPYPRCEKDGMLVAPQCEKTISMQSAAKLCEQGRVIIGGNGAEKWALKVYNPADDAEFVLENAYLTAEGAVYCAMRDGNDGIRGASCTILGCGRIARFLAQLLSAWGADVTIAARKEKDRAFALENGWRAIGFDRPHLEEALQNADFVFNTVPHPVLDASLLRCIRAQTHLYELASAPYGFSMETAMRIGLQAHLESGLPGKYAPYAAARAIFRFIERLTEGERAHV